MIEKIIKNRRTHKNFTGESIDPNWLRKILKVGMHAPCHKRNWPWRLTIIDSQKIPLLWKEMEPLFTKIFQDQAVEKKEKLKKRFLKVGALVYVSCLKDESPLRELENYGACSAMAQNIFLLMEAHGKSSFWSTGRMFRSQEFMNLMGRKSSLEFFVGALWLGTPEKEMPKPTYCFDDQINDWR